MRTLLILLVTLCALQSPALCQKKGDTLPPGVFDTVSIEIQSKAFFPFCAKLYSIPRDCGKNMPPECCSYSTYLRQNDKVAGDGHVSCGNGSMLSWFYFESVEIARQSTEGVPPQMKNQHKQFSVTKIKCLVMGQEADGFMTEAESFTGYKSYVLYTYGSHNGYSFSLQYHSMNRIITNEDIQPFIREILWLD